MILDNRTRWASADLEAIILAALHAAGISSHAREHVHVVYGRSYSGYCRYPWSAMATAEARRRRVRTREGHPGARMILRVPRPSPHLLDVFDVPLFVWLVRHEVGHWRGLRHDQMHPLMRHCDVWEAGYGSTPSRSLPPWADFLKVDLSAEEPKRARKSKSDADALRAEKLEHARAMLAKAERRAKLAKTIETRWTRRVRWAQHAIDAAASRGKS